MLLIIGTVRLPAHKMEAARPIMKRMAGASRLEEGCLEYGYAEDVFEPGLIHVKEMWVDQCALDRHFGATHLAEWRAAWPSLEIGDRNLRVYDVGEPRPTQVTSEIGREPPVSLWWLADFAHKHHVLGHEPHFGICR